MHRFGRAPSLLLIVMCSAVLVACGDDDPGGPATQPAPDEDTDFDQGLFDQIPRYYESEAVGERTQTGGVTAQSFRAENVTPSKILDFYVETLDEEWRLIDPVQQLGPAENPTYRGQWRRGEWVLIVSAAAAPTLESSAPGETRNPTVQYSLSLEPVAREGTPLTETTG